MTIIMIIIVIIIIINNLLNLLFQIHHHRHHHHHHRHHHHHHLHHQGDWQDLWDHLPQGHGWQTELWKAEGGTPTASPIWPKAFRIHGKMLRNLRGHASIRIDLGITALNKMLIHTFKNVSDLSLVCRQSQDIQL